MVECELAERGPGPCQEGPSLDVLRDVQKAYEERMDQVDKMTGVKKLQVCLTWLLNLTVYLFQRPLYRAWHLPKMPVCT